MGACLAYRLEQGQSAHAVADEKATLARSRFTPRPVRSRSPSSAFARSMRSSRTAIAGYGCRSRLTRTRALAVSASTGGLRSGRAAHQPPSPVTPATATAALTLITSTPATTSATLRTPSATARIAALRRNVLEPAQWNDGRGEMEASVEEKTHTSEGLYNTA